jgi:Fic family protein
MKPFVPAKLPISGFEWERLVPFVGRSNRALAHYDGVLCGVPNTELLLSPLTTQEAILSSRIEGTQASLSEVLQFEAGEQPGEIEKQIDIQEILNYRSALYQAEKTLKTHPLSLNLIRQLHATLLNSVRGRDQSRGEFRRDQNWIGKHGTPITKADFVPPSPLILPEFLDDWEKYYHSDQLDPLVQLAIVHAQFEILHPFRDGNGRIGRILIPLFLYEKRLLARPTFYLSEWLEEHREEYVQGLRDLGKKEDAWPRWIEFFLTAIEKQAQQNVRKAREIMSLYDRMKQQIIGLTHSQYAVPLLDQLFKHPVFRTSDLKFKPLPTRASVASLVKKLEQSKILKVVRIGSGRRGTIYAMKELLNLCEGRDVV